MPISSPFLSRPTSVTRPLASRRVTLFVFRSSPNTGFWPRQPAVKYALFPSGVNFNPVGLRSSGRSSSVVGNVMSRRRGVPDGQSMISKWERSAS